MEKLVKAFEKNGWVALSKFGFGLLDDTKNALKFAPIEYKYLLSILLAAMWCIAFGIYTVELFYIGHNIIGHWVIIIGGILHVLGFQNRKGPYSKGIAQRSEVGPRERGMSV